MKKPLHGMLAYNTMRWALKPTHVRNLELTLDYAAVWGIFRPEIRHGTELFFTFDRVRTLAPQVECLHLKMAAVRALARMIFALKSILAQDRRFRDLKVDLAVEGQAMGPLKDLAARET